MDSTGAQSEGFPVVGFRRHLREGWCRLHGSADPGAGKVGRRCDGAVPSKCAGRGIASLFSRDLECSDCIAQFHSLIVHRLCRSGCLFDQRCVLLRELVHLDYSLTDLLDACAARQKPLQSPPSGRLRVTPRHGREGASVLGQVEYLDATNCLVFSSQPTPFGGSE